MALIIPRMPQQPTNHSMPFLLAHYDDVSVGKPIEISVKDTESIDALPWQELLTEIQDDHEIASEWLLFTIKCLFDALPDQVQHIQLRLIKLKQIDREGRGKAFFNMRIRQGIGSLKRTCKHFFRCTRVQHDQQLATHAGAILRIACR